MMSATNALSEIRLAPSAHNASFMFKKYRKSAAANLLYFVVKNHSFHDGNKRIAAALFLYFLNMNDALWADGAKRISDSALVALTIMTAESKPDKTI